MNLALSLPERDKSRVAGDFGQAASRYDQAARLQRQVGDRLLQRLVKHYQDRPAPRDLADLGCGTGLFLEPLARTLTPGTLWALDLSPGMLDYARQRRAVMARWLVADAEAMPLASNQLDGVFSSLMLQWCDQPWRVAEELARCVRPGGVVAFATLVEGTLTELDQSWQSADPGGRHVNRFLPAATVQAAFSGNFEQSQWYRESRVLDYAQPMDLMRELKDLGARYKDEDRRHGATSPGRLRRMLADYQQRFPAPEGGVRATWEVLYGVLSR